LKMVSESLLARARLLPNVAPLNFEESSRLFTEVQNHLMLDLI
jgi:hypothetical protein